MYDRTDISMIYFGFEISWPIKKESNKNQKNYFCKKWLITKQIYCAGEPA